MSVTLTLSWAAIAAIVYVAIALMVSFAAYVESMSHVNPRHWETVAVGALWPWLVFQIAYAKTTGRYFVKDVKRLLPDNSQ